MRALRRLTVRGGDITPGWSANTVCKLHVTVEERDDTNRLTVGQARLARSLPKPDSCVRRVCCVEESPSAERTKREAGLTTIATKECPIYFSIDIGEMQLRSVANDW